jgi:hypothetical protein
MAARVSQAALAGNEPEGSWASGPLVPVCEHLFHDGMVAVLGFGLECHERGIGEHRVVAPRVLLTRITMPG